MRSILFFIILLFCSNCFALTVVQTATNTCSSVTSCSVTVSATGAGNLLFLRSLSGNSITSVTDGTTNFIITPFSKAYWYLPKSNSGKTSITVNYSGTVSPSVMVWEVSGFNYPVLDQIVSNSGSTSGGSDVCANFITTSSKEIIFAYGTSDGGVSGTTGSFTFDQEDSNGDGYAHLVLSTPGTNHAVFIDSGASFSCTQIGVKETQGISRLIK